MKYITLILSIILMAGSVHAGLLYNYSQLALRDLDEMNKLVQSKIIESKKSGGDQVIPLKEALEAVYTRPNDDFMIEKIISPLRNALEEHDAYEDAIKDLVKEATGALKNSKAFQPVVQVSYSIFLENLIAEMKPRLDKPFENGIVTKIRDAKIQISKEAKNEHRIRVMRDTPSPSDLADAVLKSYQEKLVKEKAEADAAAKKGPAGP